MRKTVETPANTTVFSMEVQNSLSVRICAKLASPTHSYVPTSGFQSWRLPANALNIG